MTSAFAYNLFGLRISSDIELPELVASDGAGDPDVRILLGSCDLDAEAEFAVDGDMALLSIREVASYQVVAGARIVVEPDAGAPLRNVRLYLLGSAMGVLLHQRGDLPLHANAVEIGGRAVAFMGRSGSGKSTLAAAFHDRGYRVIADDVCVVRFDTDGRAFAYPGIPRLRLWEEALTASGRISADYELSYAGDESFRKYDVPVTQAQSTKLELAAIYRLVDGDEFDLRPLAGAAAAEAIFANTYRGAYVRTAGDPRAHWSTALRLISAVPTFELARRWDLDRISTDLGGMIGHADSVIRSSEA